MYLKVVFSCKYDNCCMITTLVVDHFTVVSIFSALVVSKHIC